MEGLRIEKKGKGKVTTRSKKAGGTERGAPDAKITRGRTTTRPLSSPKTKGVQVSSRGEPRDQRKKGKNALREEVARERSQRKKASAILEKNSVE